LHLEKRRCASQRVTDRYERYSEKSLGLGVPMVTPVPMVKWLAYGEDAHEDLIIPV